jgi:hypothetical protein
MEVSASSILLCVGLLTPHDVFPWILALLQMVGLASAWLVRTSEGSRCETLFQGFFLLCLGSVGLATLAAFGLQHGTWCFSSATLGMMVVLITCEFPRRAGQGARP